MFKFNKNGELLDTIEKQKNTIERYEGRLRDIVQAYKSLQNEKDALEASVHALSNTEGKTNLSRHEDDETKNATAEVDVSDDTNVKNEAVASGESQETTESAEETSELHSLRKSVNKLQGQLQTLTQSLATVTAEKSRIVSGYQADKKKLKNEHENLRKEFNENETEYKNKISDLEENLNKAHDKIREQQVDREQEQSTHSIMLKELQNMVRDERTRNTLLQDEIGDLRKSSQEATEERKKSTKNEQQTRYHEEKIQEANDNIKEAETTILQLQNQIFNLKTKHLNEIDGERLLVLEADERVNEMSQATENRVASLENQIAELSKSVGRHTLELNKSEDTIMKLRERVSQLHAENMLLTQYKMQDTECDHDVGTDDQLTIEDIHAKITEYKARLTIALKKENYRSADNNELLASLQDEQHFRRLYLTTKQDLQALHEQYNRFKSQTADSSCTGSTDLGSYNPSRMDALRNELSDVRERHFHLRSYCDNIEDKLRKSELSYEQMLLELKEGQCEEMKALEENFNVRAFELEREMRAQRERTVSLLVEKDREIEMLKNESKDNSGFSRDHSRNASVSSYKVSGDSFVGTEGNGEGSKDVFHDIIHEKEASGQTLFHYSEELARKDVAIQNLRRQKKQIELQMRRMHENDIIKGDKHNREVESLEKAISKHERSTSRESANLEYLKNVLYQFLTTKKDNFARQQMLQAVTTILQFSNEETKVVLKTS